MERAVIGLTQNGLVTERVIRFDIDLDIKLSKRQNVDKRIELSTF
jgi:hypothetical protein